MKALKSPLTIGLLVVLIVTIVSLHLVFGQIEAGQTRTVTTVIGSLLRDESTMSRSYLLAQSIEDMQQLGVIRCASLTRVSENRSVFYDSTFKDNCPKGRLETVLLPGLDGNQWEFKLVPKLDFSFYFIKWATMLVTIGLLLLGYRLLIETLEREKTKQKSTESKRLFLEHLADQVRHDVASPISALRVIAERAPLDKETKAFLNEAVSRVGGIFDSLKQFKDEKQIFDARERIKKIIEEKRISKSDFPSMNMNISDFKLKLSPTEFDRMISNLLENSFEAGARSVDLEVVHHGKFMSLVINDDGNPYPGQVLKNLGQRGNTYGKSAGSGLGLYQCHNFMTSIGGKLQISNVTGQKTVLSFPSHLSEE